MPIEMIEEFDLGTRIKVIGVGGAKSAEQTDYLFEPDVLVELEVTAILD